MKAFTRCTGYFLISIYYDLESSEKKGPQIKRSISIKFDCRQAWTAFLDQ